MLRAYFHHRMRRHAKSLLRFLFPSGYDGEFFLCGGAFKPLLRSGKPVNDLDLWVRNKKERQKLCAALIERGATLLHDFHPYCIKFRLDGRLIEITYHNVKDGTMADVVSTFDLGVSSLGVRYEKGKIVETFVSEECWHTIQHKEVTVLESYMCLLILQKTPSLLRTLHRMGQQAAELGYTVHAEGEHRLWDMYWNDYTEEERRAAMDVYFDTMVAYKGQHCERLIHRATMGAALPVKQTVTGRSIRLRPKAA